MASFTIEHETQLSKEETFNKIKKFLEASEGLKKFDDQLQCTFDDVQFKGKIKGSKFEGEVKVEGTKPSKISLTVNLNFLLTPFKGKIQETLQSKIRQVLG